MFVMYTNGVFEVKKEQKTQAHFFLTATNILHECAVVNREHTFHKSWLSLKKLTKQ